MPLPPPDVLAAKRNADSSKTLLLKHATAHLAIVGKINVCLRHKKSILQQRMSLLQSLHVSICFWSATLLLADFFSYCLDFPLHPSFQILINLTSIGISCLMHNIYSTSQRHVCRLLLYPGGSDGAPRWICGMLFGFMWRALQRAAPTHTTVLHSQTIMFSLLDKCSWLH